MAINLPSPVDMSGWAQREGQLQLGRNEDMRAQQTQDVAMGQTAQAAKDKAAIPGLLAQYKSGNQGALMQIAQKDPKLAETLMGMEEAKAKQPLMNAQTEGLRASAASVRQETAMKDKMVALDSAYKGMEGLQQNLAGESSIENKKKIRDVYMKNWEKVNGAIDPNIKTLLMADDMNEDYDKSIENIKTLIGGSLETLRSGAGNMTSEMKNAQYFGKNPKQLDVLLSMTPERTASGRIYSSLDADPAWKDVPTAIKWAFSQGKYDSNTYFDPVTGKQVPLPDAAAAVGQVAEGKSAGEERGKELGKAQANLADRLSSQPQILETVQNLHELGKKATFRRTGQAADAVWREISGNATEGAKAREAYLNMVSDVLLPQLRPTFGAQFTLQEGENLKKTLGDINKTPEEKDAAFNAYIDAGFRSIQSGQRRTGVPVTPSSMSPDHVGGGSGSAGGVLHVDKDGNKAMVFPDGHYEEVK